MVTISRLDEDTVPQDIIEVDSVNSSSRDDKPFDTELELRKYLGSVQSRIRVEISDDFKHAKLDEKDKQAVIDMTDNAYNIVRIYNVIESHATKWDWNKNKGVWEQRHLNNQERATIRKIGRSIFDSLMTKVTMTCIMNINKPDNDLVELLANPNRDKENTETKVIQMADEIREKQAKKDEKSDQN